MTALPLTLGSIFLLSGIVAAQQTPPVIPAANEANHEICFNRDGCGSGMCEPESASGPSGSTVTGDSNNTDTGQTPGRGYTYLYDGSYRHRIVDYVMHFSGGIPDCDFLSPTVAVPYHRPFVLEFSRYYQSRASYIDRGLGKGWTDNFLFNLTISEGSSWRNARLEFPYQGAAMDWIDPGPTGTWADDTWGDQSMHLELTDEPGDQHLVTDRWGGRYHFVPNTGSRPYLQYLVDRMEDENGNGLTLSYDDGYLTRVDDDFGRSIEYTWGDSFSGTLHITAVRLPDGRRLSLEHRWTPGLKMLVHYPNGDVASYGWSADADGTYYFFNDPLGNPGSRKDRVYFYESEQGFGTGRVRGVKNEAGHVKYARVEEQGSDTLTLEHRDGRRLRIEYGQETSGQPEGLSRRVTELTSAAVHERDWKLGSSLLENETDALGNTWSYGYIEGRGLRTRRDHPDGSFETWAYDGQNRVRDYTDRNGNLTQFGHDARGNLTRKTHADGSVELWARGARGEVTAYTDRNGHVTSYEYDPLGNLSQLTLPADPGEPNPLLRYAHDVNGRVESFTDAEGRVYGFEYDAVHRLIRKSFPDGTSSQTVYGDMSGGSAEDPIGEAGLVVTEVDRRRHAVHHEYGEDDRLLRTSGALGELLYVYDSANRLVSRVFNGDEVGFEYDALGRVSGRHRTVDANTTLTTEFHYDLLNRLVKEIDPYGFDSITAYDSTGRVVSVARQIDDTTFATHTFGHDGNGNVISHTDPNGNTRAFEYDSDDRVTKEFDPAPFEALFVQRSYDAHGNLLSRADQEGNARTFTYTARHRRKTVTDPTGNTRTSSYFLDDRVQSVADAGTGGMRSFTYGCCGRVSSAMVLVDGRAADIRTRFEHDGNGNLVERVDGEGHVWKMAYDARDRLVQQIDPLGKITRTAYSDDGSPLDPRLGRGQGGSATRTDPDGNEETRVFDGLARVIRIIDAAGESTRLHHDLLSAGPDGTLVGTRVEDREGNCTETRHDGMRRVVEAIDELGHVSLSAFDPNGNRIRFTDADGNPTLYSLDSRDLTTQVLDADGGTLVFTYRDDGLAATRTDPNGQQIVLSYDAANRLTARQYGDPGPADLFEYDAGGRLIKATSGLYGHVSTRSYDPANRLVAETQDGRTVSYDHDRRSLVTGITPPSGTAFDLGYTPRRLLGTVVAGATSYLDQSYGDAGRLVEKRLGNGTTTTIGHDERDRIISISHARGATDLQSFLYAHDQEGNPRTVANVTFPTRGESCDYDAAYRLVNWERGLVRAEPEKPGGPARSATGPKSSSTPSSQQVWSLDPLGNWDLTTIDGATETRVHNAVNELVSIDGGALTYDANGNLLDDGTYRYEFDPNDQLAFVRLAADDSLVARYRYDAHGRRVERDDVVHGELQRYVYDRDRVLEERTAAGVLVATYVYGNGIDEVVARIAPADTLYYHGDSLHSVVALSDRAGAVVERYEYDAYGRTTTFDAALRDPQPFSRVGNPYTFTGRRLDREAGLMHFRARAYSPRQGRFLGRDPVGIPSFPNLYEYASSSPFTFTDPMGLAPGQALTDAQKKEKCETHSRQRGREVVPEAWLEVFDDEDCDIEFKCICCGPLRTLPEAQCGWFEDPDTGEPILDPDSGRPDGATCTVTLCYDHRANAQGEPNDAVIAHEMTHVWQYCSGIQFDYDDDCEQCLCFEFGAHYFGEGNVFDPDGVPLAEPNRIRNAEGSARMSCSRRTPGCSGKSDDEIRTIWAGIKAQCLARNGIADPAAQAE